MSDQFENHAEHTLELESLHVHYGPICALRDVSHRFACGTAVALVGGNGAGKSTLMKGIVGLVAASAGEVLWCGQPVTKSTHEIAYLPQRADINWDFPMTVHGLVQFGRYPLLGWWKRYGDVDRDAVDRALEMMRISDLAHRQVGALSGGQQQRALIARALAQEAHVLLLDEPFAGLDQQAQDMLARLLKDLASGGCLVIASHHDLKTVGDIFDEVVLLNRTLIASGSSGDLLTETNLEKAFNRDA